MSLGLALKAFFATLFNPQTAARVRLALQPESAQPKVPELTRPSASQQPQESPKKVQTERPRRSEAITLLSTLQREARFLDLVLEPLDKFEDAQIGAAAREVLRDSRKTLDRIFEVCPLATEDEGATCNLPSQPSPARFRLVGKSVGTSGTIAHRGWQAKRCEIPNWTGTSEESLILAPIEVDVA